jgi:predicted ribosome quality control (RQC) complex YloA/Tae2 family protein
MAKIITKTLRINEREYIINIGRNALGNEFIIKSGNKCDLWFHLENESSPHLVLENNDSITKEVIRRVGMEIYKYKKSKDNIIYTEISNVKCTNIPGSVITKQTKVLKYF